MFNLVKQLNQYIYTQEESLIPPGWSILVSTDDLPHNLSGYKGMVFVQEDTKELAIVSSGMTLDFGQLSDVYYDICAWLQVYNAEIPNQYQKGVTVLLNEMLKEKPFTELKDYSIVSTGHSLGATLSDMIVMRLNAAGLDAKSLTLENMGTLPILKQMAPMLHMGIEEDNYVSFNTLYNDINELHAHVGEVVPIMHDGQNETTVSTFTWLMEGALDVCSFAVKYASYGYQLVVSLSPVVQKICPSVVEFIRDSMGGVFRGIVGNEKLLGNVISQGHAVADLIRDFDSSVQHNIENLVLYEEFSDTKDNVLSEIELEYASF